MAGTRMRWRQQSLYKECRKPLERKFVRGHNGVHIIILAIEQKRKVLNWPLFIATEGVVLFHVNARLQSYTPELERFKWEQLDFPSYSLDILSSCDFKAFDSLKNNLKGKHLQILQQTHRRC
ncbi:hypothetical protein TNIN_68091 [Trichonephila inaurata madagascariensis]|uniref:Uncharacterized protein n=1 Tax=Trichonephila inaurata madagascariensis TaxID=2747483 RepID=A0A8X7BYD4_9ARAC|nr:hypothetical protein TNIN_68091 [Trichonephila inaurata madagascariensis]